MYEILSVVSQNSSRTTLADLIFRDCDVIEIEIFLLNRFTYTPDDSWKSETGQGYQ